MKIIYTKEEIEKALIKTRLQIKGLGCLHEKVRLQTLDVVKDFIFGSD